MHTKSREVHWFPVHFPGGVIFSGFFRRGLHGTRDLGFHVLQAVQQQRIEGPAHPGTDHLHHFAVGTGVAVHRADCPNADPARRKPSEAGRWNKVSWGSDTKESYRTTLEITAKDRINIIMDVSTVLSSTKTHVSSLNARSTPAGFALLSLDIDVPDSEQRRTVMRRLEQISGGMRVTRPAG